MTYSHTFTNYKLDCRNCKTPIVDHKKAQLRSCLMMLARPDLFEVQQ